MAASAKLISGPRYLESGNEGTSGKKMAMVISEITFDSDKTCQVPCPLSDIMSVQGTCADVTAPAANVLGCDRVKDTGSSYKLDNGIDSTSYVTVGATADNSDTYRVTFFGYI